ncbi:MAG TPA: hypothetical protein VIH90_06020 [Candidatus Saccharimonadales bacterium]
MATLQLSSSERKAPEPAPEISKKKRRKIEQLLATQELRAMNRRAILDRVDAMPIESAQQRLLEVKKIIEGITRDLLSYKKGATDIPKMIESGLHPKEWAHRAGLARGYLLLERKLIRNKLKPPKQEALDAGFNEIVRKLESVVDVENNAIDNNSGNNS